MEYRIIYFNKRVENYKENIPPIHFFFKYWNFVHIDIASMNVYDSTTFL